MKTVPVSFMLENVPASMILALSESVAKLFIFASASSSLFVSLYTIYILTFTFLDSNACILYSC